MPPRKRARVSQTVSPSRKTPETSNKPTDEDILNDPWTDEEEIGLFKGLIKWKPTGIHKHFRMLQLRDYLLEHNHIHHRSAHTRIPGIWQKLESLYDLEALDQREDARQLSELSEEDDGEDEDPSDDLYSVAANKIHNQSFELPDQEYGAQLWKQRFAIDERDESPPAMPEFNMAAEAPVSFTPSFSIEPDEVATPTTRPRGRPPKNSTRAKAAVSTTTAARRSRRQAESVATGSEEEQEGSDEGSSEDEDREDGNEDEDDEAASQTSAPTSRARGRGRGRGAPRGRPRGRRR